MVTIETTVAVHNVGGFQSLPVVLNGYESFSVVLNVSHPVLSGSQWFSAGSQWSPVFLNSYQ